MERRAAERTQVTLNMTCRMPAFPRRVTIHDVSQSGCKLELRGAPIEKGGTTLLELPGCSTRIAGRACGRVSVSSMLVKAVLPQNSASILPAARRPRQQRIERARRQPLLYKTAAKRRQERR